MKKNQTLIIFICLLSATIYAQNTPFRFGVSFYPNYGNAWTSRQYRSVQTAQDAGKLGYAAGLFAEKSISQHIDIRLGAQYATLGFETGKQSLRWPSEYLSGTYVPDPALAKEVAIRNNFTVLEIPVDVHYHIRSSGKYYLSAGVTPLINLKSTNSTVQYYMDGHETTKNENLTYNEIGCNLHFGVGYSIQIAKKMQLEIQPEIRGARISLDGTGPRLYQIGVNFAAKI